MVLLHLLANQAHAAHVVHSLCVSFDEQFQDPWPAADYWKTNTPRVLRGVRMRMTDVNTNVVVYDQFAAQNAPLAGCHTLVVNTNRTYRIEILPEAQVRGYHLVAKWWDGTANGPVDHPFVYDSSWVPPANPNVFSLVVPWDTNSGFGEIAVAQYMANKAGHLGFGTWPGNEIYYLLNYKLGGATNVMESKVDDFNLCKKLGHAYCVAPPHIRTGNLIGQGGSSFTKFTIAHETGHWIGGMLDRPNDPINPYFDLSALLDECNVSPPPRWGAA